MLTCAARTTVFWIVLVILPGCTKNNSIPFGNGYIAVTQGGNSLTHNSSNQQLWRISANKEKVLVWPYLMGDPYSFTHSVVFPGGVQDDRHGALRILAHKFPGKVVEIGDLVLKKYCTENSLDSSQLVGNYSYAIYHYGNDPALKISAVKSRRGVGGPDSFLEVVEEADVERWISEVSQFGVEKSYAGVGYLSPPNMRK